MDKFGSSNIERVRITTLLKEVCGYKREGKMLKLNLFRKLSVGKDKRYDDILRSKLVFSHAKKSSFKKFIGWLSRF